MGYQKVVLVAACNILNENISKNDNVLNQNNNINNINNNNYNSNDDNEKIIGNNNISTNNSNLILFNQNNNNNNNCHEERLECQVPFEYIDVYGNADFSFLKYTKRSEFRKYLKKAYNIESLFDKSFRFNSITSFPTIKYYYSLIEDDENIKKKIKEDSYLLLV
ncbi:hypothetical protein DDB_G0276289 [Dictyostelium discoideum AX4]|uniref:Uncharacterized protein DDB_G0276289 n=1 Tax=Dictyostelium discoideum TaxID=44689 RepID=Y9423_DICDI|nr:hypothetical protein DDB_G0276289 [Dictyostelium discoideum AX4]Q7KWS1.1 RecName: Full=Uncharacterized protein DDB_G0276289 [Dictyostelium discoideum]EAL69291.1 hypothetical protein DDB_G0276289 [Dictyostelium discoideum AX4]|eukprot:XP_643214.1 hypothetical protein DDB_G0276289 [Dictyostelium discoideum AX4]